MDAIRTHEYLVKKGWNQKKAKDYADALVSVFWGLLKTAY